MKIVEDGWKNLLTKVGVLGKDKQLANQFVASFQIGEEESQNLFLDDGIGRKVVTVQAREMVRSWIKINGDPDGVIVQALQDLNSQDKFKTALQWDFVFGGSILLMGIDDGGDLDMPVNEKAIKSVVFLKAYDRYRLTWISDDLQSDPTKPFFGEPEYFTVNPITVAGVVPFRVHRSRLLIFDGMDVTEKRRQGNQGWGDSIYQAIFKELSNFAGAYDSAKNIIDDFVQTTMQINNLMDLIASGQEEHILKRLDILDLTRHVGNMVLLDGEEKFEKKASTVTGLPQLLDKFMLALSGATNIPVIVLMGQTPQGLNATGDENVRLWYDHISDQQETKLRNPLELLIRYIMLSKTGPTKGKELDSWSVEFKSLWQSTEKEILETRKLQSEIDDNYINNGTLDASEVAISRFGGDQYSYETIIDESAREESKKINDPE